MESIRSFVDQYATMDDTMDEYSGFSDTEKYEN